MTATTVVRRSIVALWFVLLAAVLGVVLATRLAPLTGHELVVIRSGSMAPAIPTGSLIAIRPAPPEGVHAGDVVTLRMRTGQLLTHRVERVADLPDGRYLATKGDANPEPDPVLVPVGSVVGVVDTVIPYAGYALAYLSMPTGMVSVASFLAALLLTSWLFEERRPTTPVRPVMRPGPIAP